MEPHHIIYVFSDNLMFTSFIFSLLQPKYAASLQILKVEIGGDSQSSRMFFLLPLSRVSFISDNWKILEEKVGK